MREVGAGAAVTEEVMEAAAVRDEDQEEEMDPDCVTDWVPEMVMVTVPEPVWVPVEVPVGEALRDLVVDAVPETDCVSVLE